MTTPPRMPALAWAAVAVCVAAAVLNIAVAATADNAADRALAVCLAAAAAGAAAWAWRIPARRHNRPGVAVRAHVTRPGARPEGVTIHHPDGTTTVCELAYAGRDEHGHAWHVATPFRVGVDRITIDVLPPGCYVAVPIAGSDPPH